jgi:phage replication O-like protein O
MASPQVEDGHLRLSNELAEAFARLQLSGNQWRIFWVIVRQTYGWQRKSAQISVTRFQQMTELDRRHVARAIKALVSRKIVAKIGNSFVATYGLNKDYSQWKSLPKLTRAKIGNSSVAKIGNGTVAKIGTPIKIKETLKKRADFLSLKNRYKNQTIIDQVFDAIATTRKSGRVSENVLTAQLMKWERYPIPQIEAGIKIYLAKDYAGQGRDEAYLLGIIRNSKNGNGAGGDPQGPSPDELIQTQPSIQELLS